MAKGVYVGVANFVPRNLPTGYTQVEYIDTPGPAYINTNYYPKGTSRVVMDVQVLTTPTLYFGTRNSNSATASQNFSCLPLTAGGVRSDYMGTSLSVTSAKATDRTIIDQNQNVCSADGYSVTHTLSSTECSYPLFLFAYNTAGTATTMAGTLRVWSCQVYANGTLTRDYVPCINAAGTVGLYDDCNKVFYGPSGSGTFTAGPTHGSVARKIKKGYLGIAGVARKIKKAYIGIGGVARPCWAGGELAYYGAVSNLTTGRWCHAATAVGDYALIGGGSQTGNVEAYSSSLTKKSASSLVISGSSIRANLAAASVGDYAIFGGGETSSTFNGYYSCNVADCYNSSLTKVSSSNYIHSYVCHLAAASVGNYAIFAGGKLEDSEDVWYGSSACAFDTSLTKKSISSLSSTAHLLAATAVGDYAIFGGGSNGSALVNVNAYNLSLTRSNPTSLYHGRYSLKATAVGDYAIFGGGGSSYGTFVDVYDTALTRTTGTAFSVSRTSGYAATTLGNYALFIGGWSSSAYKTVEVYDASLTHTLRSELTYNRDSHAAVTIGNYALITGGQGSLSTVEAYTIA